MFTSIRSVYGALGVMLFLIAVYLVLENAGGASKVITSVGNSSSQVFRTLQGRK